MMVANTLADYIMLLKTHLHRLSSHIMLSIPSGGNVNASELIDLAIHDREWHMH